MTGSMRRPRRVVHPALADSVAEIGHLRPGQGVGWRAGSVATQQAAPETILFRAVAYGYTVAMTSITTAPASDKPERKGRLSAEDWAQAALELIAENGGGADAVEAGVGRRGGAKGDVTWPRPAREAVVQAR